MYGLAANESYVHVHKSGKPLSSKDSYPPKRVNLAQTNPLDISISTYTYHAIIWIMGCVLEGTMLGDAPTSEPTPEYKISEIYVCRHAVRSGIEMRLPSIIYFSCVYDLHTN